MTKGTVHIQTDRCKGCGLCIQACPQHVLVLADAFNARGYRHAQLDEHDGHCIGCGICAIVCPDVAFTVYREPLRRAA